MIETIEFNGRRYPKFQAVAPASQFAMPYAKLVCKGKGYDIGPAKKAWGLSGATLIDIEFPDEWHALNLPEKNVDYIFSSHCLEHVDDWVATVEYWHECLRKGGVLFLYLPHYSQEYWRPWNNRKHRHVLSPEIIEDYMRSRGYENIFVSGVDLNNSFMAMAEKG